MKQFAALFVAMLLVSCGRQPEKSTPVALNTVESVISRQVMHGGQLWVEVTLSQRLNPKAPAYVVGIRESRWANRLQWALVEQTLSADRVTSRFRLKPINGNNEITLTKDDFEWFPPVNGFEPIEVSLKKAESTGLANGSQPSGSGSNHPSSLKQQ